MTINEYIEELAQVPKKLVGTLLEKFLETEEVQKAKKILDHAQGIRHEIGK